MDISSLRYFTISVNPLGHSISSLQLPALAALELTVPRQYLFAACEVTANTAAVARQTRKRIL